MLFVRVVDAPRRDDTFDKRSNRSNFQGPEVKKQVGNLPSQEFQQLLLFWYQILSLPSSKNNIAMEHPPLEDIFPIGTGEFLLPC